MEAYLMNNCVRKSNLKLVLKQIIGRCGALRLSLSGPRCRAIIVVFSIIQQQQSMELGHRRRTKYVDSVVLVERSIMRECNRQMSIGANIRQGSLTR